MGKIDILLSTFNGEKYIRELLDSLIKQTFCDWRLLIRDDGSTDNTVKIVYEYARNYPDKIVFAEDEDKNIGVCQSFARLLEQSDSEYAMFCDQDDVWLDNKIEITFNKMKEIESKNKDIPVLIHTDLRVVDAGLSIVSNSMWRFQKLDPRRKSLNYLIVQNNVTGCTTMINKKLKEIALPLPKEAIVHDWWVALSASAFGEIGYIDRPTILYRQHGKNDIGAKEYSLKYFFARLNNIEGANMIFYKSTEQAGAFLEKCEGILDEENKDMLECFSSMDNKRTMERLKSIFKYRFTKSGLLRNAGYVALLLYTKGNLKAR